MATMEIKDYNKSFGVYAVINTSECTWAVTENHLISVATSVEDFLNLGFDIETDGKPFTEMKVGDKVSDTDYEGVYIMRIG